MEHGGVCVTVDGTQGRPLWCVDSLDTRTQVSVTIVKVYQSIAHHHGFTYLPEPNVGFKDDFEVEGVNHSLTQ